MRPPVPVHYLRRNESEWSPRHVAFFDTETVPIELGSSEVHTLRCWAARAIRRDEPIERQHPRAFSDGTTADGLVAWIEDQLRGRRNLWLWAHNLGFDLTVTRLVTRLVRRGWTVTDFAVIDRSPWFRLARRSKSLTLLDSWSWLPDALAAVGEQVGIAKPDLPDFADDLTAWLVRCRGDVVVTAAAVLQLLDWWDREALGRWSITGAATGYNAMRHTLREHAFTIDPDPTAIALERRAVRGGRRDVWRTGTCGPGPFAQLDIALAYSSVAEHLDLPRRRWCAFDTMDADDPTIAHAWLGVLAECVVHTAEPRYSCTIDGVQWWPTGTFRTVLAGPELREARERGDLASVGPGYIYQCGRPMAPWAAWCNRVARGEDPAAPAVARMAAKSWCRSVLGKWAGHASEAMDRGAALTPGWSAVDTWSVARQCRGQLVELGGRRWQLHHDQDADNAFPAVLAWVESHLRVRMARALDALGPGVAVSCDTDGIVVDLGAPATARLLALHGAGRLRSPHARAGALAGILAPSVAPLEVRTKAILDHVRIAGPSQLTLGGTRRWAGIPRAAVEQPDGTLRARTWPGLRWQMAQGDPRGYLRPEQTWRRRVGRVGRWQLANGALWPVQARLDADGRSELVPYLTLDPRPIFDLPAAGQHPALLRLGPLGARSEAVG